MVRVQKVRAIEVSALGQEGVTQILSYLHVDLRSKLFVSQGGFQSVDFQYRSRKFAPTIPSSSSVQSGIPVCRLSHMAPVQKVRVSEVRALGREGLTGYDERGMRDGCALFCISHESPKEKHKRKILA